MNDIAMQEGYAAGSWSLIKQGVALTGRNTTGPPASSVTDDDDNRRQRPLLVCLLHCV